MPLSAPVARDPLHRRRIDMCGYIREDGLWDIEGHLHDSKAYDHETRWRGDMPAGTPVHEMWIRLTLDDNMVIQSCECVFDNHPFPTCLNAAPNFSGLAGIKIGVGWMREVRRRVGGTRGCTHVIEMLSQVGTTAYQTFVAKRRVKGEDAKNPFSDSDNKPFMIDSCHAMAADGPVVKESWPKWYTGDDAEGDVAVEGSAE